MVIYRLIYCLVWMFINIVVDDFLYKSVSIIILFQILGYIENDCWTKFDQQ